MPTIEAISVNNIVTYDKATLNLVNDPMIVIRGRNLDSRLKKDATTKVGKSVLLSTVPNLLFNAAPTSAKKKSGREMHSKGSEIRIKVRQGKQRFDLLQRAKGKSVAYDVEKDGKPMNYRTGDGAMKHIQRILPMNEQQFYSFNYIDARNPSLLQRGSAADRFHFFENVFNLDLYDKISAEIAKEHNKLKFAAQTLKEAEAEYALRKQAAPKSIDDIRAKREDLFTRANKVRRKVDNYLKELRVISTYMTLAEGTDNAPSLKELKAEIAECTDDLAVMEKRYKNSVKYFADMQAASSIIERRVKLNRKVKEISEKIGATALAEGADTLRQKRDRIAVKQSVAEQELSTLLEVKESRERADQAIADFLATGRIKPAKANYFAGKTTFAKAINIIAGRQQALRNTEKSVAALGHKHAGGNCPVCRTQLSDKVRGRIIDECLDEIEQHKAAILKWTATADYLKLHEAAEAIQFDTARCELLERRIKRRREEIAGYDEYIGYFTQLERAQRDLAALPKVKFEEKKTTKPEVFEDAINGLRERITALQALAGKLTRLAKLDAPFSNYAEAEQRYQQLQAYIDKYQPLLEQAQDALDRMTAKQARAESAMEELKRLRQRVKKYRDESAEFRVYDALRATYGPKGLRKARVAEIAARFEVNLNRYSSLIFTDPIVFSTSVNQNRFDILAARNNKPAADVRTLSGSESRAFALLCLLALLPFAPEAVRTNLVVLDEMESLMDDPSVHLFTHEFLPKLSSVVPNIVVVTSRKQSQLSIPGAKTYTVVKQNGRSKLVEDNFAEKAA